MKRRLVIHATILASLTPACWLTGPLEVFAAERYRLLEKVDVAPVWSGHPVRFALLTEGERQFVAFYDAHRQMTVAARWLTSAQWQFVKLKK